MTAKDDFTAEEWELILGGPPSAGLLVATAQRGGTFRETFSIAKAYAEARRGHGDSQLLDEIAAAKPEMDHTRYHSLEELQQHTLERLREAVAVLERKATPQEADEYGQFVVEIAEHVAEAHREGILGLTGERVSESEREAVEKVKQALGAS